jgi:hypothetical protein
MENTAVRSQAGFISRTWTCVPRTEAGQYSDQALHFFLRIVTDFLEEFMLWSDSQAMVPGEPSWVQT